MRRVKLVFLVCLLFAGCSDDDSRAVPYELVDSGEFSGIEEPSAYTITNGAEWHDLWARHEARRNPPRPLPEVDFSNRVIVAIFAGQRPTPGYEIRVDSVLEEDGTVVVRYRISGNGSPTTVVSQPFIIVAVPKGFRVVIREA